SRYSCTPEGASTGIITALNICSVWWGNEEERAPWSSPATANTPPNFDVPAALACRNPSPERSTPGPLPYHMPDTPSLVAPSNMLICWVPHVDVAASSSLTPGWKWVWLAFRYSRARHRC